MVNPFPYAAEVCREIVELGGRNFILTHRGVSTLSFLEYQDMLQYFTEVVTKKYGFKRKPDPESFLYVIDKYNIDKDAALVVGDREYEILGGKAAGIKACLYNTNNVEFTEVPDFEINSLKQLVDIIK